MTSKNKIWIILALLLFIALIYISYITGRLNGFMIGVSGGLKFTNHTVCDMLSDYNPERYMDDEGYCVMEDNYKYSIDIHCPHGNYRFIGDREMNNIEKFGHFLQKVFYYPITGCW